jgi:hypothetical protein
MFMTTDPRGILRRILGITVPVSFVVAGWIGVLAIVTVLFEPTGRVLLFGPNVEASFMSAAVEGLPVATAGPFVQAVFEQPGFTRRLYASGVWLILPAPRGRTCFTWAQT